MNNSTKKYFILFSLFLLIPFILGANKISKKKDSKNLPIEITAEKMTSNQKNKIIIFKGNVVAKQGELTIFSDKMDVYSENKEESNEIEKIIATGHVKLMKGERLATGDRAVYLEKDGRIILTGNPRAWEKDNEIFGTEMIFLIDDDKFEVTGSKDKKIKLMFYPGKKDKNEK